MYRSAKSTPSSHLLVKIVLEHAWSVSLTQSIVTHPMSADLDSEIEIESADVDQGSRINTPVTQTFVNRSMHNSFTVTLAHSQLERDNPIPSSTTRSASSSTMTTYSSRTQDSWNRTWYFPTSFVANTNPGHGKLDARSPKAFGASTVSLTGLSLQKTYGLWKIL